MIEITGIGNEIKKKESKYFIFIILYHSFGWVVYYSEKVIRSFSKKKKEG